MKKFISLLLVGVICFSLCSCANNSSTDKENETEVNPSQSFTIGDVISTDIFDLTIDDAQFCFYADGSSMSSSYLTGKVNDTYYLPTETESSCYVASVGHTLISLTFTVTNKDRVSRRIGGTFEGSGWEFNKWTVRYNGKKYDLNAFNLNNPDGKNFNIEDAIIRKDDGFYKADTMDQLLDSNESMTIRVLGIVNVDPENLSDNFELNVNVQNSKDKDEKFAIKCGGYCNFVG